MTIHGTNILGSVIILVFKEAIFLSKFRILSGGKEHPNDILPKFSEISYSPNEVTRALDLNQIRLDKSFNQMGRTNENGSFNIAYDPGTEPQVKTIRVLINQKSKYWLWIYDIYIEKAKRVF